MSIKVTVETLTGQEAVEIAAETVTACLDAIRDIKASGAKSCEGVLLLSNGNYAGIDDE